MSVRTQRTGGLLLLDAQSVAAPRQTCQRVISVSRAAHARDPEPRPQVSVPEELYRTRQPIAAFGGGGGRETAERRVSVMQCGFLPAQESKRTGSLSAARVFVLMIRSRDCVQRREGHRGAEGGG